MPARRACPGDRHDTTSPSHLIVPVVAGIAPERILMRVDFPAPLAPINPCTSPVRTVKLTPASARVPFGYVFVISARPSNSSPAAFGAPSVDGAPEALCITRSPLRDALADRRVGNAGRGVSNEPSGGRVGAGEVVVKRLEGELAQRVWLIADCSVNRRASRLDWIDRDRFTADTDDLRSGMRRGDRLRAT